MRLFILQAHMHTHLLTYLLTETHRRSNWIALKMRKLMKSRSRERDRDRDHERDRIRSLTPTRSESCEGLPCHDNGSFVSSQGSAESGANSLDDSLSPKRSSSEYDVSYPPGPLIGQGETGFPINHRPPRTPPVDQAGVGGTTHGETLPLIPSRIGQTDRRPASHAGPLNTDGPIGEGDRNPLVNRWQVMMDRILSNF